MPEETRPGQLPTDLPPEYADAYRRAYERAYREAAGAEDTVRYDTLRPEGEAPATEPVADERPPGDVPAAPPAHEPPPGDVPADEAPPDDDAPAADEAPPGDVPPDDATERTQVIGPLFGDEVRTPAEDDAEPTQMLGGGFGPVRESAPAGAPGGRVAPERSPWLVPGLLAGAVILLVIAAYSVGRVFSGGLDQAGSKGDAYSGPVEAVAVTHASASCRAPDSVDAAGHPVSYHPRNVGDGDPTTAWRCAGSGVGQKVTLRLPAGTEVAEVGLVPGYAKTDPVSGADRYAENNRITKVRWVFGDGTTVEQRFDGSARNRAMQTMRMPPTKADRVAIEVLATTRGPRDTTAISEVRIARPTG